MSGVAGLQGAPPSQVRADGTSVIIGPPRGLVRANRAQRSVASWGRVAAVAGDAFWLLAIVFSLPLVMLGIGAPLAGLMRLMLWFGGRLWMATAGG